MNPNYGPSVLPKPASATPLLDLLERAAKAGGSPLVQRLIHSPVIEMIVAGTPTPIDDLILAALKAKFPLRPSA